MRLIDADEFMENLIYCDGLGRRGLEAVLKTLKEQPTAYDISKVVAELEEMIKPKQFYFCKYAKGGCKHIDNDEKDCMECIIEMAINIVRKGGIDEIPMDESYK